MTRRAIQVVDLGFGDAGKGSLIDYLGRRHDAQWIVRFNGGPQAGHNVVLPDGRHHTFAQFGSASFQPAVRTLLSRRMLIDPYAMLNEAEHLREVGAGDVMARTWVDQRCLVITPPQQIANRIRERARGAGAHGTCGVGVGECVADSLESPGEALRAGELSDRTTVTRKLLASLERKRHELRESMSLATPQERRVFEDSSWIETAAGVYSELARCTNPVDPDGVGLILRESTCTLFEGAQGVLLDERFGFHPHTTWSKTTYDNADALLDEAGSDSARQRIGVMRPYAVRHGNGPLVTEDPRLSRLQEPHNRDDGTAGRFRRGILDLVLLRYAIRACGRVDRLAVTCLDHLPSIPPVACDRYELNGTEFMPHPPGSLEEAAALTRLLQEVHPCFLPWPVSPDRVIAALGSELGIGVAYRSHGPTWQDKKESGPLFGRRMLPNPHGI